jgi:hypothetical protein
MVLYNKNLKLQLLQVYSTKVFNIERTAYAFFKNQLQDWVRKKAVIGLVSQHKHAATLMKIKTGKVLQ